MGQIGGVRFLNLCQGIVRRGCGAILLEQGTSPIVGGGRLQGVWVFWWGRGGFAFGMTIGLVWVLCMFCTRECFEWYQIRSPLSVTVMIGGVVVCVGLYLLGGLCINRRRPSLEI